MINVCQPWLFKPWLFYLANMGQRHVAFCERHVALHERHVFLIVFRQ